MPQICCLFGPSAAGGAYIPAFCDVVFMVEGNASMYLGSPRMAEVVIGETVSLEEMGGARMHATVSGCGDNLVPPTTRRSHRARRRLSYLSYLPSNWREAPPCTEPLRAEPGPGRSRRSSREDERAGYDMHDVIDALVDDGSRSSRSSRCSPQEIVIGFARLDGRAVGIVANNPKHLGGVLFVDSADKAARFIWLLRRVQRAARVPRRRARLHDRDRTSSARASSVTAPR